MSEAKSNGTPVTCHLFTIPLEGKCKGGNIVVSEVGEKPRSSRIYVLTFTSPPDNRLITPFIEGFTKALDVIEFGGYPSGVLVTTSGIPKFYSNGLDLNHATTVEGYWQNTLYNFWARLLTFPMPTIALMNGHAFAGGLMTAMFQDYRIFNPEKGFLCLNELDFGAPLKAPMSGIFRSKCPPQTYRSLVLEAKRFPAREALQAGIVDALGSKLEDAVSLIEKLNLAEKAKTGVYGTMKHEMYRECLGYLRGFEEDEKRDQNIAELEGERASFGAKWVAEWVATNKKAPVGSKL